MTNLLHKVFTYLKWCIFIVALFVAFTFSVVYLINEMYGACTIGVWTNPHNENKSPFMYGQ